MMMMTMMKRRGCGCGRWEGLELMDWLAGREGVWSRREGEKEGRREGERERERGGEEGEREKRNREIYM